MHCLSRYDLNHLESSERTQIKLQNDHSSPEIPHESCAMKFTANSRASFLTLRVAQREFGKTIAILKNPVKKISQRNLVKRHEPG